MTNYSIEKGHWQAVISVEQEGPKKILNYILKRRCSNKTVFDSQERMARHFGVCTRTIRRWLKPWTDLLILKIRQRNLTTALYEVNPYLLKFSEKYKQIFPALRHFAENALAGIFKQNVLHNYNDINNSAPVEGTLSNSSSSFQDLSLNLLPQSIQLVGAEYSSSNYAHNYPDSSPFWFKTNVSTCLEWAPSSMEEEVAYNKFIREAEDIDSLADYVEPTTLDEIKSKLTIPDLIEFVDWIQGL